MCSFPHHMYYQFSFVIPKDGLNSRSTELFNVLMWSLKNEAEILPSFSCSHHSDTDVSPSILALRPHLDLEKMEHLYPFNTCSLSSGLITSSMWMQFCPRRCMRGYPQELTASVLQDDWHTRQEFCFYIMLSFYVIIFLISFLLTSLQSFQKRLPKPQQKAYDFNSIQFISIQQLSL